MTRRAGLSLTEVLVALFIMAIGVMGVLTMFPLGAVQMGQAVKDQRCAEAAGAADSYMKWYWRHYIVETQGKGPNSASDQTNNTEEPLWSALNGANTPVPQPTGTSSVVPVNNNPSPPVFVDPMGWVARGAGDQTVPGTGIRRRSLRLVDTSGDPQLFALRTCTLLDGFGYDESGVPRVSGSAVERENRYNWLWVVQRPKNADRFVANLSIVVFDRRVHMYTPSAAETTLSATGMTTGSSTLNVSGAVPAALQRGSWIADVSTTTGGIQLCDFYRVVSVTGNDVELDSPLRAPLGQNPGSRPGTGTILLIEGAAEVFEKPQGLVPDPPVL